MDYQSIGLDISLNHLGMCFLDEQGKYADHAFITDVKKYVTADPAHGMHYKAPSARSDDPNHFLRVREFCNFIYSTMYRWNILGVDVDEVATTLNKPFSTTLRVAIEGYGFASKSTRLRESTELVGAIKQLIYQKGVLFRVHDPDSVKLFAVGNGHATKEQMHAQFVEETHVVVPHTWRKEKGKKILDGPGTDVADAYFLARLLWTEMELRKGKVSLHELPEYQIRVFNRTTKAYPVNLLDRPFVGETNV